MGHHGPAVPVRGGDVPHRHAGRDDDDVGVQLGAARSGAADLLQPVPDVCQRLHRAVFFSQQALEQDLPEVARHELTAVPLEDVVEQIFQVEVHVVALNRALEGRVHGGNSFLVREDRPPARRVVAEEGVVEGLISSRRWPLGPAQVAHVGALPVTPPAPLYEFSDNQPLPVAICPSNSSSPGQLHP